MTTQLELATPSPPVTTATGELAWLESWLRANGRWHGAGELLALMGRAADEDNKRRFRELVGGFYHPQKQCWVTLPSEWIISGDKGYCHLDRATAEEIHHALARQESQIKRTQFRLERLRRNAHRRLG